MSQHIQIENHFPTANIQPISLFLIDGGSKIVYCTKYIDFDEQQSGIFVYNIETETHRTIKLWTEINYYAQSYVSIYDKLQKRILFVGGYDVKNNKKDYKVIMMYNMKDSTINIVDFNREIGGGSRLILTNNHTLLHITGGSKNDHHILYNLVTNKSHCIHSFENSYSCMNGPGLIHNKITNEMIMFGGFSKTKFKYSDDYWTLNMNHFMTLLSPETRNKYLVKAYIHQIIVPQNYALPLIDIIVIYLENDNKLSQWKKDDDRKLPLKMAAFGYVLFDNRIIITFGGMTDRDELIDNIYYLDLNGTDSWKKCTLKCAIPGQCNAILVNNKTVHILPNFSYNEYSQVDVNDLLPSSLLQ